jgi:hypothetical protein
MAVITTIQFPVKGINHFEIALHFNNSLIIFNF